MFLPLHDQNPLKIVPFQFVTMTIILINIAVFAWQALLPLGDENSFVLGYGMVPAVLFDHRLLPPDIVRLPAEITLLTYMFLHTDIWHLLGNMLFLWVFADNIEDAMGHFRFALFYLLCGIAAGLCHGLFEADSIAPLIGASGAAAGVLPDGRDLPGKRHVYPEMAAAGLWTNAGDLARFAVEVQRAVARTLRAFPGPDSVKFLLDYMGRQDPVVLANAAVPPRKVL